jgi:hypothetical protein
MGILKDDIHKLIDTTEDKKLLEGIFMILSGRNDYREGELWSNLTQEQKESVLDSESEIGEPSAWISHEEMKVKNKKWLR